MGPTCTDWISWRSVAHLLTIGYSLSTVSLLRLYGETCPSLSYILMHWQIAYRSIREYIKRASNGHAYLRNSVASRPCASSSHTFTACIIHSEFTSRRHQKLALAQRTALALFSRQTFSSFDLNAVMNKVVWICLLGLLMISNVLAAPAVQPVASAPTDIRGRDACSDCPGYGCKHVHTLLDLDIDISSKGWYSLESSGRDSEKWVLVLQAS